MKVCEGEVMVCEGEVMVCEGEVMVFELVKVMGLCVKMKGCRMKVMERYICKGDDGMVCENKGLCVKVRGGV